MPQSPVFRTLLALTIADGGFSALLGYMFLNIMGLEGEGASTAFALYVGLWVVKTVAWVGLMSVRLRPLSQWFSGDKARNDPATITEVANHAYRAPFTICISYALAQLGFQVLHTLVLYFGFADSVLLGPSSLPASAFSSFSIMFAALVLAFPLAEWMIGPLVEAVSLKAHDRGITIRGRGLTFRGRLAAFALVVTLTPTLYLSSIIYMNDARAQVRDLERQAELAALEAVRGNEIAARTVAGWAFSFDDEANVTGRDAARVLAERPRLARLFEQAVAGAPAGTVAHPREGVVAFRTEGGRRYGVVLPHVQSVSFGTTLLIALCLLIVASWGPMTALLIARSTSVPVVRVSEALALVGDGEVASAPKVAVFHLDEVGTLARNYNIMLDQMRVLVRHANEVSKGALDIEFEARGDLGDAFRGQVVSLRDIVGHIAQSASQLAGAASEMYAAAQEQEAAAQQQSVGIEEVSRTMESLLVAATHVTESTLGVLTRAERTRETTGRTAERIAELSAHASRIGEILETIREIADRSDLLALNASLEGTRAGEAGRGFALVAAEMRKLAERVTASVTDIKKLVSDVRASVSATVIATEESTTLAEGTTESARQINLVTQQQRSGTEQAGQSMRDVASMITQSLAATQQIRSLAENLKVQADNLSAVVARFRLPQRRPEAGA